MRFFSALALVFFCGCVIIDKGEVHPTYELETVGDIALNPKNPEELQSLGFRVNFKSKW